MRKYVLAAVLVLMASGAQATLIDRGEGFIYDDVNDITWTQNANINGLDTWANQVAWASGYSQTHTVYGTFDDWRLPTTLQPDPSCSNQFDPGGGFPLQGSAFGCTGSEMGHLFNVDGIHSINNHGPFTNVQSGWYWSGTESVPYAPFDPPESWVHASDENVTYQHRLLQSFTNISAWAVRAGDVVPIPEPSTGLLVALGLTSLSWKGRRRNRS